MRSKNSDSPFDQMPSMYQINQATRCGIPEVRSTLDVGPNFLELALAPPNPVLRNMLSGRTTVSEMYNHLGYFLSTTGIELTLSIAAHTLTLCDPDG